MTMSESGGVATLPQKHLIHPQAQGGASLGQQNEPWQTVLKRTVDAVVVCCADGRLMLEQRKDLRQKLGVTHYHQLSLAGGPHCFTERAEGDGINWTAKLLQQLAAKRRSFMDDLDLFVHHKGVRKIALVTHEKCAFLDAMMGLKWSKFGDERRWHLANRESAAQRIKRRYPEVEVFSSFAQADENNPGYVRIDSWMQIG